MDAGASVGVAASVQPATAQPVVGAASPQSVQAPASATTPITGGATPAATSGAGGGGVRGSGVEQPTEAATGTGDETGAEQEDELPPTMTAIDLQAARQALDVTALMQTQAQLSALPPELLSTIQTELLQLEKGYDTIARREQKRRDSVDSETVEGSSTTPAASGAPASIGGAAGGINLEQPVDQIEAQKAAHIAVESEQAGDVQAAREASGPQAASGAEAASATGGAAALAAATAVLQTQVASDAAAVDSIESLSDQVVDETKSVSDRLEAAEALLDEATSFLDELLAA